MLLINMTMTLLDYEHLKEFFFYYPDHFDDQFKLRGGIYFVDSLPTTPSGKIVRRLVKNIAVEKYGKTTQSK